MKCNMHQPPDHESDNSSNHYCISQVPIFCHLNSEEMAAVDKVTMSRMYHKGEMIFLSGEPLDNLFIINKGTVKISRITETGKEQILRILKPGEFFGELSLFGQTSLTNNAEALEHTEICYINKTDIEKLILLLPNIALKILAEFTNRLEMAETLIEQLGLHDVEQRVAGILLQLAAKEERIKDKPLEISLSMSKRDLASLIGTTQETLSRKLSFFQENGWIELKGHRHIMILDEDSLRQIVSKLI